MCSYSAAGQRHLKQSCTCCWIFNANLARSSWHLQLQTAWIFIMNSSTTATVYGRVVTTCLRLFLPKTSLLLSNVGKLKALLSQVGQWYSFSWRVPRLLRREDTLLFILQWWPTVQPVYLVIKLSMRQCDNIYSEDLKLAVLILY